MGDRGNIVLEQEIVGPRTDPRTYGRIYLYTHWGGWELSNTLHTALARRERWSDETYLGRIIFDAMVAGDTGSTGFGIGLYPSDNEYNYLVVNSDKQVVVCEAQGYSATNKGAAIGMVTFEQFVSMDEAQRHTFHETGEVPKSLVA